MKNQPFIFLLVLLILLLSSCAISMEKRRYRPGYHVETVSLKQSSQIHRGKEMKSEPTLAELPSIENSSTPEVKNERKEIREMPSNPETKCIEPVIELKEREKNKRDGDSCDVIFTAAGKRIQAKVIEITEKYVNYKLCDDPKGRLFSVKTKEIDNITLRNGELFVPKDRVIVDKEALRKKSQTLLVASIIGLSVAFIGFVFSFFIAPFGTLAVVFLILAGIFNFVLLMMNIKPGKYAPSYRTKLTWIFYLLVLLMVIAGLILAMFI